MAKSFGEITSRVSTVINELEQEKYNADDIIYFSQQFSSVIEARAKADVMLKLKAKAMDEFFKRVKSGKSVPDFSKLMRNEVGHG